MVLGMGMLAGTVGFGWLRAGWLAALACIALPAAASKVSDDFDRGKGERTITYIADGSTDSSQPVFTFNASFAGDARQSAISLAFVSDGGGSVAPQARLAGCREVEWIVDGQPVAAGPVAYEGRLIDGDMVEWLDQAVDLPWVAALGAAQTAHYRVCRQHYSLSPSDIQAFALIANKFRNAALAGEAASGRPPTRTPAQKVDYQGMQWRPRN